MRGKNRLILEYSEFNIQQLNPIPASSARTTAYVDDPSLSINAFDKHEDAIRTGVSRINNILHSLSNSSQFRSLKSKLALEDQKIIKLKILRIVNLDNVDCDFYISFRIQDKEYFGVVKNVTSKSPELKSEVFDDSDLIQTPEWIIRMKGIIIKTIKQWLRPEEGVYKLLSDNIFCNSVDTPNRVEIKKGDIVEVIATFENKIVIKYKNDNFYLLNQNFIYFNYWFEKI